MSEFLSPLQRLELIRLVNALPSTEFDELLFALNPKDGVVPSNASAQGNRAKSLLTWVEGPTGCGLMMFLETLDAVAPGAFKVTPSSARSLVAAAPAATALPIAPLPIAPQPHRLDPSAPGSFTEDLGEGVTLVMIAIPEGRFWMGSPENELRRQAQEGPQHRVAVPAFAMGQYPVTQRQWRAVSLLDDVEMPLTPMPANFKGDDLPVEQVNWYQALEFCQRLSRHTGRLYRLPSEAEWEYACRAGTLTPFPWGDTISTDQANYDGSYIYGRGKKGIFRRQTTVVGSFEANGFGLYDLRGNVWEWCQDVWHDNYEGAPTDGSVWLVGGNTDYRVMRGGSWDYSPEDCRSAFRSKLAPELRLSSVGLRVVCSAGH